MVVSLSGVYSTVDSLRLRVIGSIYTSSGQNIVSGILTWSSGDSLEGGSIGLDGNFPRTGDLYQLYIHTNI